MKVEELRQELINLGLPEKEAKAIVGKENLLNKLNEMKATQENINELDKLEPEQDVVQTEENVPERNSVKWHDYVMSKFDPDELCTDPNTGNKVPNIDGLRRVTELLVGRIVSSIPTVHKSPSTDDRTATVSYIIRVEVNGVWIEFGGAADCGHYNTDPEYARFAVSNAETRAEARALRKCLGLRKVVAFEEVTAQPVEGQVWDGELIQDVQIKLLDKMCKESNINLKKFINMGESKYDDVTRVPRVKAGQMIQHLNELARGARKIPDDIVGYEKRL